MKTFQTFIEIQEDQDLDDLRESLKEIHEDEEFASDIDELLEMEELLERAPLTVTQRRKRAIIFRRLQPRIQMAKKRQMRRMANTDKLLSRAKRQAKNKWRSRLAGGKPYGDLSISEKVFIDKRLAKKSAFLSKLAKRMLPKVRKAERDRFSNFQHKGTVQTPGQQQQVHTESVELNEMDRQSGDIQVFVRGLVKRYHGDRGRIGEEIVRKYGNNVDKVRYAKSQMDIELRHIQTMNDMKKRHGIDEDAPANNAGEGNVAGLGVGPEGEPGGGKAALFKKKKIEKRKNDDVS